MGEDPERKQRAKKLGTSNTWSKGFRYKNRKGYIINPRGYKMLYFPDHPTSDSRGYIMEHRLVMEKHIVRLLNPVEKVHHKNKNRLDNRIENLELCKNQSKHIRHHKDVQSGKFV